MSNPKRPEYTLTPQPYKLPPISNYRLRKEMRPPHAWEWKWLFQQARRRLYRLP